MLHSGGSSTMRVNFYSNVGYYYINYIFNPSVTYTTLQFIKNGSVLSGKINNFHLEFKAGIFSILGYTKIHLIQAD